MCLALMFCVPLLADVAPAQTVVEPPEEPPRIVLRSIKFAFDSASVDAASVAMLRLVADWLEQHPEARLRIEGHSSAPGSEAYNLELSLQRARGVQRVLVDYGVAPDRLEVVGRGESQPLAPNDTREGRALNRRIEFVVVEGGEAVKRAADTP
jgi:OOP family OmpA-OmpF porin